MLPYGALWRLDQALHPAGPPQRRTVALRRRQALFFFCWAIAIVSLFVLPRQYLRLRRLQLDSESEMLGRRARSTDTARIQELRDGAVKRLLAMAAAAAADPLLENNNDIEWNGGDVAGDPAVSEDFAYAFYHHASSLTRLDGVFAHPYMRALAGGGSGVLWPRLGGGVTALQRARTLNEIAAEAAVATTTSSPGCLLSLRRDGLQGRLGNAAADDDIVAAVQTAIAQEPGLQRMDVSPTNRSGDSTVPGGDIRAATETVLAELLLWLVDRDAPDFSREEALSRTVAACAAPPLHTVSASFEFGPTGAERSVKAATTEVALTAGQYICLCAAHGTSAPSALTEPRSSGTTSLFLVDPSRHPAGAVTPCSQACRNV